MYSFLQNFCLLEGGSLFEQWLMLPLFVYIQKSNKVDMAICVVDAQATSFGISLTNVSFIPSVVFLLQNFSQSNLVIYTSFNLFYFGSNHKLNYLCGTNLKICLLHLPDKNRITVCKPHRARKSLPN